MFQKNNSSVEPQKLQNNVTEPSFQRVETKVMEDSSSYDNEILRVKNIFKIGTPPFR